MKDYIMPLLASDDEGEKDLPEEIPDSHQTPDEGEEGPGDEGLELYEEEEENEE